MKKELQDYVWQKCGLPKEFKEEVKKMYATPYKYFESNYSGACAAFNMLFGIHNLTSDAEGEEELLHVTRQKVMGLYANAKKIHDLYISATCINTKESQQIDICKGVMSILDTLFGSKCLPDEKEFAKKANCKEPKPAEPKFKVGDTVMVVGIEKYDRIVFPILDRRKSNQGWIYEISIHEWINEAWLEPYIEPKDLDKRILTCTDDCSSPEKESSKMKPIESKVSVYLATEAEDEEFRQLLHKNGFTWYSGSALISRKLWSSRTGECKMHYVHPDKTVSYCGDRTSETLTFSEFKRQYFIDETSPNANNSDIDIDKIVAKGYVPDPAKQFDNILKDSFRGHNRLHIAAMAMQGILANPTAVNGPKLVDGDEEIAAKWSLKFADALIAEAEKGGGK